MQALARQRLPPPSRRSKQCISTIVLPQELLQRTCNPTLPRCTAVTFKRVPSKWLASKQGGEEVQADAELSQAGPLHWAFLGCVLLAVAGTCIGGCPALCQTAVPLHAVRGAPACMRIGAQIPAPRSMLPLTPTLRHP